MGWPSALRWVYSPPRAPAPAQHGRVNQMRNVAREFQAPPTSKERYVFMVALFLLSASTLLFEVLHTKLFANKLYHHFTFAIISMALLGFGAAGVYVQLRSHVFRRESTAVALSLFRYALG